MKTKTMINDKNCCVNLATSDVEEWRNGWYELIVLQKVITDGSVEVISYHEIDMGSGNLIIIKACVYWFVK